MRTIELSKWFARTGIGADRQLEPFALLSRGIIDFLADAALSPDDAVRCFFNGENCLFVQRKLRNKTANEIMGRGVQLSDLFNVLPKREAERAFERELSAIRLLCSRLLKSKPGQTRVTAAKS